MSQRAGMNVYNQMSDDLAKVKAELVREKQSHDSEIMRLAQELSLPQQFSSSYPGVTIEDIIKAIKKLTYCPSCRKRVNTRCAKCDQEL